MLHLLRNQDGEAVPIGTAATPADIPPDTPLDGIALVLPLRDGDPRREILKEHEPLARFDVYWERDAVTLARIHTGIPESTPNWTTEAHFLVSIQEQLDEPRGPVVAPAVEFGKAIRTAAKGIGKWVMPIEQHLLLRSDGTTLTISASDNGRHSSTECQCKTTMPLLATVAPRQMLEWLRGAKCDVLLYRSMSDGSPLTGIMLDDQGTQAFQSYDPREFPVEVEAQVTNQLGLCVDAAELRTALSLVLPSVGTEWKPRTHGVYLVRNRLGHTHLWATNEHHLAHYRLDTAEGHRGGEVRTLLSAQACTDILKALGNKPQGNVVVGLAIDHESSQVWFDYRGTRVTGKHEWTGILTHHDERYVNRRGEAAHITFLDTIDKDDFWYAILGAHVVNVEDRRTVLRLEGDTLHITADSPKIGTFRTWMPVTRNAGETGDAMCILNSDYLKAQWKNIRKHLTGEVALDIRENNEPVQFTSGNYAWVLMPMQERAATAAATAAPVAEEVPCAA